MIEFGDVEFYLDKDSPGFAPEMNFRGFFEIDDEGQIIEIELMLVKAAKTGWLETYYTLTPEHWLWEPLKAQIAAQFYVKIEEHLDQRALRKRSERRVLTQREEHGTYWGRP